MADETRLERHLDTMVARAATPRGAAIVIASATTTITLGAGIVMTAIDHQNYPSIGSGLWWAVQTVTTVGYGDNVPMTLGGRLVAVLVMLVGIGFLTVVTAAITSTFVSRSRREQTPWDAEAATALRQLDSRLDRIEAALGRSSPP
jgi:voltage-gated potassium channel